ncbi:MAG: dihydrolipoyl dehydrogenase [Syntrophales bacterium]
MEPFDLIVIGSGPGGYPAAIRAAQLGAKVALVEKERIGGTCLNWGCIPTKTLIASSSLYHRMCHAGDLGVSAGTATYDYAAMVKRKDSIVSRMNGGVEQLLKGNGVKIFRGTASFLSAKQVSVAGAEESLLEAKNVIIATGSTSALPGFVPRHERIVESRRFLELDRLPASLIVLGGGVIGCEFACLAAQLGVKVTIVELLGDILLVLDPDVRREVRRSMTGALGITVLTGKPLENIRADAAGVTGEVSGAAVSAEMLLVAVGRAPSTAGLGLEKAGLATTASGHIEIDSRCATKAAGIYAIGDVTAGSTQLAHAATSQGMTAAENACGTGQSAAETLIPAAIFTAPEIGSVGLTEELAKAQGRAVRLGKFFFAALGKAVAAGENSGFVKWIADAETDRLLGAQAVGAHATELIAEATSAVRAGITAREAGRIVRCHPTLAEAWTEAAHAVHGEAIHAAPRRRPA